MTKSGREHERLDIDEMERRVARAVLELIDAHGERQRISAASLALRTNLPVRIVREVAALWELQTPSGDEYVFGPGAVARIRARA